MQTLEIILAQFPDTMADQWRQHSNGGGWVHSDAIIKKDSVFIGPDAVIHGGVINGGVINGGVIHDGVINGGVIRGGVIRGGEWETSPIQIQGSRHFANNSEPGHIQIGCHNRTFSDWTENFQIIGDREGYTHEQIAEYKSIIDHIIKFGK